MTVVRVESGIDAGAVAHCGQPLIEQRMLDQGRGWVDLSHRGVVTLTGPDRLEWLHSISTQHVSQLRPGEPTSTFLLDPQGRIRFWMGLVDTGDTLWAHTEPGMVEDLVAYLDSMRFMSRVEVTDRSADVAVVRVMGEWHAGLDSTPGHSGPVIGDEEDWKWSFPTPLAFRSAYDTLGGHDVFLTREDLASIADRPDQVGMLALEARRIDAGMPRVGVETDERTIPNEILMPHGGEVPHRLGGDVHLEKGCYTGQETVARVWNMGRPPRRLARLQLDGSMDEMPQVGADLCLLDTATGQAGKVVGRVGASAHHFEDGPIALALIKRNVAVDAPLVTEGVAASQEVLVDPEVGLHVRPRKPGT